MLVQCKNFPQVASLKTRFWDLDCNRRVICVPNWEAEFVHAAPKKCETMSWQEDDWALLPRPFSTAGSHTPRIPLLALVFTRPANFARRAEVRKAWLRGPWFATNRGEQYVPWRYAFVVAVRRSNATLPRSNISATYLMGDIMIMRSTNYDSCEYRELMHKTLDAIQWALTNVQFEVLLKCDDDTVVHVSRLWGWLLRFGRHKWPRLYAGRLEEGGVVIRTDGSTRRGDGHIFTDLEMSKWAVPYSMFNESKYPSYAKGGGYLLGSTAAAAILNAANQWARSAPRLEIEDAFVGILAKRSRITPVDIPLFIDQPVHLNHAPLRSSILIHPKARWRDADLWRSQHQNIGTGKQYKRYFHQETGYLPLPYIENGCDCANIRPRLCTTANVEDGCWYTCCKHWVPSMGGSGCGGAWQMRSSPQEPEAGDSGTSKPTRYIIFASERTASTVLCWALHQHPDVQCNYEMMNARGRGSKEREIGASLLWDLVDQHQQITNITRVPTNDALCRTRLGEGLDLYWDQYCRAGACGFKVFHNHLFCSDADFSSRSRPAALGQLERYLTKAGLESGCQVKIIFLQRDDKAAAYHSLRKAMCNNAFVGASMDPCWAQNERRPCSTQLSPAQSGGSSDCRVSELDQRGRPVPDAQWRNWHLNMSFEQYVASEREWSSWVQQLTRRGLEVLSLSTEELLEKRQIAGIANRRKRHLNLTAMNRIANFLNVPPVFQKSDVDFKKMKGSSWWQQEEKDPLSFLWEMEKATDRSLHIQSRQHPPPVVVTLFFYLNASAVKHSYDLKRTTQIQAPYYVFCGEPACTQILEGRADGRWGSTTIDDEWDTNRLLTHVAKAMNQPEGKLWQALRLSVTDTRWAATANGWRACPSPELMLIWLSKVVLLSAAMAALPDQQRFAWVDSGFNHYRLMGTAVPPAPWLRWWPRRGIAMRRHANACDKNFYDYAATRRFDRCVYGAYLYGTRSAWQRVSTAFLRRAGEHVANESTWGIKGERRMCSDQDIFEEVASEDPTLFEELLPADDWSWEHITKLEQARLPRVPLRTCTDLQALTHLTDHHEWCSSSQERQTNRTACESTYLTYQSGHNFGMQSQCAYDTSDGAGRPSRCVVSSIVLRCTTVHVPTCASFKGLRNLREGREKCDTDPARSVSQKACESNYITHYNGRVSLCRYDATGRRCRASTVRLTCREAARIHG